MTDYLPLSEIHISKDLQVRTFLDSRANLFKEILLDDRELDAAIVYQDDSGVNWLADGHHRYDGALRAGKTTLLCEIRKGSKEDAEWFALGVNNRHGLIPSPYDLEKIVKRAEEHPRGQGKSHSWLARELNLSPHTVAKYRSTMRGCIVEYVRNGKPQKMKTGDIGKKPKPKPPQVLPPPPPARPPSTCIPDPPAEPEPQVLAPDTWPAWAAEVMRRVELPDDLRERFQVLANR